MAQQTRKRLPTDLTTLAHRFEAHRQSRHRRGRLPEDLWTAAAELARRHGVYRVQQALRLNYRALQRRMECPAASNTVVASAANRNTCPAFVELQVPSAALGADTTVLEMEDRTGRKLTVRLVGARGGELAALARALWDGAP